MDRKPAIAAAVLGAALVVLGGRIDAAEALSQGSLWFGLHLASLGGAALGGFVTASLVGATGRQRLWLAAAALFAWRVSYFPVMVFSGHVASIGEWLLALAGLPIFVYATFLLAVAGIHAAAAGVSSFLVVPPKPFLRWAAAGAFFVACCVSFAKPSDLRPLPDTVWSIAREDVPPMREESGNPYLPAVTADGYLPNQRVVLVAAALTYDTIPPSAWATTVKAVLEDLFLAHPYGSAADRVLEHHLAYHAAHPLIGCRTLEGCAAFQPEPR